MRDAKTYNELSRLVLAQPSMVPVDANVAPSPTGKRSQGRPLLRYNHLVSACAEAGGKITIEQLASLAGRYWLQGDKQARRYWLGDLIWDLIHGYVTVNGVTGRSVVDGWIQTSPAVTEQRGKRSGRGSTKPRSSAKRDSRTPFQTAATTPFDGLVEAFAHIAKLTPGQAHPRHARVFTEGLSQAQKAPAPGVIGAGYRAGGVVFVARNGALGTSPDHVRQDRETAALWSALAKAEGRERRRAYAALMLHLNDGVQSWNLFRYIDAFNKRAKLPDDAFSLINMIGFRCKFENIKSFGPIYEEAFANYTGPLLVALRPSLIVPLGNDQGHQLARLYRGNVPVANPIRRSIGDRFAPKTLDEDIDAAVRLFQASRSDG